MEIQIYEGTTVQHWTYDEERMQVPLLQTVLKIEQGVLQENPALFFTFEERTIAPNHLYRIYDQKQVESADLIVLDAEGSNHFRKYASPPLLTIGQGAEAQLEVDSSLPWNGQVTLEPATGNLRIEGDIPCFIRGQKIQGGILEYEDCLEIYCCKITYTPHFIMVNKAQGFTVNLEPLQTQPTKVPLLPYRKTIFNKPFRIQTPTRSLHFVLEPKPPLYELDQQPLLLSMGPALTMSAASLSSGLIASYNGYMQGRELLDLLPMLLLPFVMILSTILWNPISRWHQNHKHKKKVAKAHQDYLKKLTTLRATIQKEKEVWIEEEKTHYLSMKACLAALNKRNQYLWNRLLFAEDYLWISLGNGTSLSSFILEDRSGDPVDYQKEIQDLQDETYRLDACPIRFDCKTQRVLTLWSKKKDDLFFWYILLQIVTYCSYDGLAILVLCDDLWLQEHRSIRLLPHLQMGTRRGIATDANSVKELQEVLRESHKEVLCLIQDPSLVEYLTLNNPMKIYLVQEEALIPQDSEAILHCHQYEATIQFKNGYTTKSKIDEPCFKGYDQALLSIGNTVLPGDQDWYLRPKPSLFELLGIQQVTELELSNRWKQGMSYQGLVAPIGINAEGKPLELDIHEKGKGPHGLIAGMTGSGKSELLTTFVLSLAVNYSPEVLQFVVIDFKGSDLVQNFKGKKGYLPHLAGSLSNLDEQERERALVSFSLECVRRQKAFQAMSVLLKTEQINIDTYQQHWTLESKLPSLPHLVIIVDEFAELKHAQPDFMKDLVSLARIGRSLGIHLVLATQKPAGQIDEQIWSNARFKICLKVQDPQDSQEVIRSREATNLKEPGELYLLADGILEKGRCAYAHATSDMKALSHTVSLLNQAGKPIRTLREKPRTPLTQASALVERMMEETKNSPSYALWKPPLEEIPYPVGETGNQEEIMTLGMIDDIYHQAQYPYRINLKEKEHLLLAGHLAKDRNNLLEVCLLQLIEKAEIKRDRIFVLSNNSSLKVYTQAHVVIDVLSLEEEEKRQNLSRMILGATKPLRVWLIIDQYHLFAVEDSFSQELTTWMNQTKSELHVILVESQLELLPFRILNRFQERIGIHALDSSEVGILFEQSGKKACLSPGFGLVKKERLLCFRSYQVTPEIRKQITERLSYPGLSKCRIPIMENPMLLPKDAFGKSYETYQTLHLPKQPFLCLGQYLEDVINWVTKHFETYDLIQNLEDLKDSTKHLIFNVQQFEARLTEEEKKQLAHLYRNRKGTFLLVCGQERGFYQSIFKSTYDYEEGLWIGRGAKEQMVFQPNPGYHLEENQGYYFHRGKVEKVRLKDG